MNELTLRQRVALELLPAIYDKDAEYGWMMTVAYKMADEFLAFDAAVKVTGQTPSPDVV